jgi:hypothetical protein
MSELLELAPTLQRDKAEENFTDRLLIYTLGIKWADLREENRATIRKTAIPCARERCMATGEAQRPGVFVSFNHGNTTRHVDRK